LLGGAEENHETFQSWLKFEPFTFPTPESEGLPFWPTWLAWALK